MTFRFRTASDLTEAYRAGRFTPAQVAERALDLAAGVDRRDPPLRCFLALRPEEVRAQAEASTARYREGRPLGPLDGVPVALKDEYDVEGYATTCGTAFLGREPAWRDALAVARLRAAGAVLFGKTNLHELGMGSSGINPHHGVARNPYDPARDTGGSSSGSAAAVASGVVPIALGTDSGGSVRVPAALCGIASLKPTFGRVPTEGVRVPFWSLGHCGPLGASVRDLRAALAVTAAEPELLRECAERAGGALRVGVCEAWWRGASPAVYAAARAAVDALVARGAVEVPVELPHVEHALAVGFAIMGVEGACALEAELNAGAPFAPAVRLALDLARGLPATTFVKAQRARARIAAAFDAALENTDVIVSPTTAVTAPRYRPGAFAAGEIDEATSSALVHFTFPVSLTGLPAAQVPCGYDPDGMPVGLQIVARRGADLLTLEVAADVEQNTPARPPRVWSDLVL